MRKFNSFGATLLVLNNFEVVCVVPVIVIVVGTALTRLIVAGTTVLVFVFLTALLCSLRAGSAQAQAREVVVLLAGLDGVNLIATGKNLLLAASEDGLASLFLFFEGGGLAAADWLALTLGAEHANVSIVLFTLRVVSLGDSLVGAFLAELREVLIEALLFRFFGEFGRTAPKHDVSTGSARCLWLAAEGTTSSALHSAEAIVLGLALEPFPARRRVLLLHLLALCGLNLRLIQDGDVLVEDEVCLLFFAGLVVQSCFVVFGCLFVDRFVRVVLLGNLLLLLSGCY